MSRKNLPKHPKTPARRGPYRKARDERVAAELVTAPSIAEAGRRAGVPESTLRSKSWYKRVHQVIRPLTLAHLARAGMTLPRVARKHSALLDAQRSVVLKDGTVIDIPDNDVQLRAMQDYYKILGPLGRVAGDMPEEGGLGDIINVNFHFPEQKKTRAELGMKGGRKMTIEVDEP